MRASQFSEPRRVPIRHVVDAGGECDDQPTEPTPPLPATVAAIMTRSTYCVRPDVGIQTLATLLLEQRVSGLPVVDGEGRPLGVVTKTDLLRHLHEHPDGVGERDRPAGGDARDEALLAEIGAGVHAVHVDGTTVADIMMPLVFAIGQDVPIVQAAALMAGEGIHRVPVLDAAGTVCGVLSALDIVRWVARDAGYRV